MEDEADINASIDSFVPDGQQENSQWLPRPWTIVKGQEICAWISNQSKSDWVSDHISVSRSNKFQLDHNVRLDPNVVSIRPGHTSSSSL